MNAALAAMLERLDDPAHLHPGPAFTEALARLQFAAEHHLGLTAVVGAGGTGKTTLLRRFRRDLASSPACVVQLQLAGLGEAELRTSFSDQLGIPSQASWLRIADRLSELACDETPLIVLADDADRMQTESLEALGRLWDADPTGHLRLSMVLAIDEVSLATLPSAWLQRVDLRVELQPWSLEDTARFLAAVVGDERMRQRGFESEAVERLHQISHGLPRLLRRYAHLSLLASEGQQRLTVDAATVLGACHELCQVGGMHDYNGPAVEFLEDEFLV